MPYKDLNIRRKFKRQWEKNWRDKNPGKQAERDRRYRENNKTRCNAMSWRWRKNKIQSDSSFKLLCHVRSRVSRVLKIRQVSANGVAFRLLGCSVKELRAHLEKQFSPGMTWENYGKWHVDHKRPCASFNLHDESQRFQCFNFSNLQPLWAKDNLKKGSTYAG